MIESFSGKTTEWQSAFLNKKRKMGIENAYRELRSFQKFNNYANNRMPCDYGGAIKYTTEKVEDIPDNYFDSAEIANIALMRIAKTS